MALEPTTMLVYLPNFYTTILRIDTSSNEFNILYKLKFIKIIC